MASVGLIVLAPRPLAAGIKLVLRECEPSLIGSNLFRALVGDNGSFSMLPLWRLVIVGTTNLPVLSKVLSVRGGPMEDRAIEDVVPVRL